MLVPDDRHGAERQLDRIRRRCRRFDQRQGLDLGRTLACCPQRAELRDLLAGAVETPDLHHAVRHETGQRCQLPRGVVGPAAAADLELDRLHDRRTATAVDDRCRGQRCGDRRGVSAGTGNQRGLGLAEAQLEIGHRRIEREELPREIAAAGAVLDHVRRRDAAQIDIVEQAAECVGGLLENAVALQRQRRLEEGLGDVNGVGDEEVGQLATGQRVQAVELVDQPAQPLHAFLREVRIPFDVRPEAVLGGEIANPLAESFAADDGAVELRRDAFDGEGVGLAPAVDHGIGVDLGEGDLVVFDLAVLDQLAAEEGQLHARRLHDFQAEDAVLLLEGELEGLADLPKIEDQVADTRGVDRQVAILVVLVAGQEGLRRANCSGNDAGAEQPGGRREFGTRPPVITKVEGVVAGRDLDRIDVLELFALNEDAVEAGRYIVGQEFGPRRRRRVVEADLAVRRYAADQAVLRLGDDVGTGITGVVVVADDVHHRCADGAEVERVLLAFAGLLGNLVDAPAAREIVGIVAKPTGQQFRSRQITAGVAPDLVVAHATGERVDARAALQRIVAGTAVDRVVGRAAEEAVVAGPALDLAGRGGFDRIDRPRAARGRGLRPRRAAGVDLGDAFREQRAGIGLVGTNAGEDNRRGEAQHEVADFTELQRVRGVGRRVDGVFGVGVVDDGGIAGKALAENEVPLAAGRTGDFDPMLESVFDDQRRLAGAEFENGDALRTEGLARYGLDDDRLVGAEGDLQFAQQPRKIQRRLRIGAHMLDHDVVHHDADRVDDTRIDVGRRNDPLDDVGTAELLLGDGRRERGRNDDPGRRHGNVADVTGDRDRQVVLAAVLPDLELGLAAGRGELAADRRGDRLAPEVHRDPVDPVRIGDQRLFRERGFEPVGDAADVGFQCRLERGFVADETAGPRRLVEQQKIDTGALVGFGRCVRCKIADRQRQRRRCHGPLVRRIRGGLRGAGLNELRQQRGQE